MKALVLAILSGCSNVSFIKRLGTHAAPVHTYSTRCNPQQGEARMHVTRHVSTHEMQDLELPSLGTTEP